MLRICEATKYYGETAAIRKVTLNLNRGEVIGLFGANGAGKTTLLKGAIGLLSFSSGWVTIDDADLSQAAFEKLSFITEEGSFFPDLTPRAHGDFYAGMLPRFKLERYGRLLEFFELDAKKKARSLSRGQRAKLEIAIGMSRGADFILMDEPFLGKDIFTRSDFLKLMIATLEPHEGVLIATHQIDEIEMFITRAVIMKQGQIVANVPMDELTAGGESLAGFVQRTCGYDDGRVMGFI